MFAGDAIQILIVMLIQGALDVVGIFVKDVGLVNQLAHVAHHGMAVELDHHLKRVITHGCGFLL